MSADILTFHPKPTPRDRTEPAYRDVVHIGPSQTMAVVGYTAEQMDVPLVELHCPSGEIVNLTVHQADELATVLWRASTKARGK